MCQNKDYDICRLSYTVMQLLGTAQGSTAASIATSSIKHLYIFANRADTVKRKGE